MMAFRDMLLPEFDQEMGVTRRLLERLPEGDFAWKPHEKSMSLGALATHISYLPYWTERIAGHNEFDITSLGAEGRPQVPGTRQGVLDMFDGHVRNARARLGALSDGEMLAMWTLRRGTETIFSMPRIAALRRFLMNHGIHHRGQLSVYLRLRDVPLPAIYGPTADEGSL